MPGLEHNASTIKALHADTHSMDANAAPPFSAYDNQAGALRYNPTSQYDAPQNPVMSQFPSADCLLPVQSGGIAERTPQVMAAVTAASNESEKLFPSTSADKPKLTWRGVAPDFNDNADPYSVGNAAYRYIMNKEGLDDYSSTSQADIATINQWNPGAIKVMNAFVADQEAAGLVPQNVPKVFGDQ